MFSTSSMCLSNTIKSNYKFPRPAASYAWPGYEYIDIGFYLAELLEEDGYIDI
jgi:hypothetical protein